MVNPMDPMNSPQNPYDPLRPMDYPYGPGGRHNKGWPEPKACRLCGRKPRKPETFLLKRLLIDADTASTPCPVCGRSG